MPDSEALKGLPVFAALPQAEVERLGQSLLRTRAEPGELLYLEGDCKSLFYIVLDGEVEIIKGLGSPEERLLATRGAGSFLGEMRLFSREGCHTASVRVHTPVELLQMRESDFQDLVSQHPEFTFELLRSLSLRLDESEKTTIHDLREKNRQLSEAYENLKAAQDQLVEAEKLEREMEVARRIQGALLPRKLPSHTNYGFSACMEPMRAVGGDLYDFIELDEDLLGIAIGDVMDHGVPAALLMSLTVTLLRAEARRTPSPRMAVASVNRQLLERNGHGFFATLLYGVLDMGSGRFKYVRAGHDLPILLDREGKTVPLARGCGQPLGLLTEPCLDVHEVALPPGSLLLMYTDGVKEAFDASGELFGTERLVRAVQSQPLPSAGETCRALMRALTQFRGDLPQSDDITLVAVRAANAE